MRNSFQTIFQAIADYQQAGDVLALMNKFQTYDWLTPYQPLDETMATMREILSSQNYPLTASL